MGIRTSPTEFAFIAKHHMQSAMKYLVEPTDK